MAPAAVAVGRARKMRPGRAGERLRHAGIARRPCPLEAKHGGARPLARSVARAWLVAMNAAEREARSINAAQLSGRRRLAYSASVQRRSPYGGWTKGIARRYRNSSAQAGRRSPSWSLACAALSCPPLRREAYAAERLDAQLDDNVRAWPANERLNQFDPRASPGFSQHDLQMVRAISINPKFPGPLPAAQSSVS
jgi:hypothetical protein